ncbi:MAG: TonB family protein [Alphaproteobacteria bacterium]|nr:TonB family protein [Alphaproteobacteria bacterium]
MNVSPVSGLVVSVLGDLLQANLAAAAAISVILLARAYVLRYLGPRAAYLSWTLAPAAALATLIPSRAIEVAAPAIQLPTGMEEASRAVSHAAHVSWLDMLYAPSMIIWLGGAFAMAVHIGLRQRKFLDDMSLGLAGPAVIGIRRQRIVTPDDFGHRYSFIEQRLILAHEQVHLERHDARINAFAALARCVCWFNPLVHIGAHMMRVDQELSCDAAVVERRPRARRAYAETLLKSRLAKRPLPVGCYWPAGTQHPLTERIAMLTRTPFSRRRRFAATAAILTLAATGAAAAWAAQPERVIQSTIQTPPVSPGDPQEVFLQLQLLPPEAAAPLKHDIKVEPQEVKNPTPRADMVRPDYPADSVKAKEEGDVVVKLCVTETGDVESAKLLRPSGYQRLDQATIDWATKLKFNPATRDGRPVRMCDYPLDFYWSLGPADLSKPHYLSPVKPSAN